MQIQDIRKRAEALGIQSLPKAKAELIRAIQLKEGNFDCYGSVRAGFCDQTQCLLHSDCTEESKAPITDATEGVPTMGRRGQGLGGGDLGIGKGHKSGQSLEGPAPSGPSSRVPKTAIAQKAKSAKAGIKGKRR